VLVWTIKTVVQRTFYVGACTSGNSTFGIIFVEAAIRQLGTETESYLNAGLEMQLIVFASSWFVGLAAWKSIQIERRQLL